MSMINLFRKKRKRFISLPSRISTMTFNDFKQCQECIKKNEELGMDVFDCEEECGDSTDDTKTIISNVRIDIDLIEEFYSVSENQCWIKISNDYQKYEISINELEKKLKKYVDIYD